MYTSRLGIFRSIASVTAIIWFSSFGVSPAAGSLVGHWSFDGDLSDSSGNGNDFTLAGGTVEYKPSALNEAVSLNGFSSRLENFAPKLVGTYKSFTLGAFVKFNDAPGAPGDAAILSDASFNAGLTYHSDARIYGYAGGGSNSVSTPDSVSTTEWRHVVQTYDGSAQTTRLFIDGVQVASRSNVPSSVEINSLRIGQLEPTTSYLDGLVDEAFLFDEVLPDSQIAALANPTEAPARFWISRSDSQPIPTTLGENGSVKVDLLRGQNLSQGENVKLYIWAQPARDAAGFYKQLQNISLNIVADSSAVDILNDARIVNPGLDLDGIPGNDLNRFTQTFDSFAIDTNNPNLRLTTLPVDQIGADSKKDHIGFDDHVTVTPGLLAANPTTYGIKPGVGIGPWPLTGDTSAEMTPYGPAYRLASFSVRSLDQEGNAEIHLQIGSSGMNHAGELTKDTKVVFAPPGQDGPEYNAGPSGDTGMKERGMTKPGDLADVVINIGDELVGDYTDDGVVDGSDMLAWQRNPIPGNLIYWQANYGRSTAALLSLASDFDDNGIVDGVDFLTWQRGPKNESPVTLRHGDANGDGSVDSADLAVWLQEYRGSRGAEAAIAAPEPTAWAMLAPLILWAILAVRSHSDRKFDPKRRQQVLSIGVAISDILVRLYPCVVLMLVVAASGLSAQEIAHWSLDNNTIDDIGSRNGTLLGDATFSTEVPAALLGYSTHSLSLDGTLDKMIYDVPNGDSLTDNFTVAAWVNMSTDRPGGTLSWFGTRFPNGSSFDFKARGANNSSIRVDIGNGSSFPVISDTTVNLGVNSWHHVAVSVKPTQYDLFVDGVLARHQTYPTFTPILWGPDNDIAIGSVSADLSPNGPPTGEDFSGLIDDVRIFGEALTEGEIQQLMTPDPTLSIWKAAGGGNWTDASNWNLGRVPNAEDSKVLFSNSVSTPSTITLDADITVHEITFDSSDQSYTLIGDGTHALTLAGSFPLSGNSPINVSAGLHTIAAPIAGGLLSKGGSGTLVLSGSSNVEIYDVQGPLVIAAGGSVSSGDAGVGAGGGSGTLSVDGDGSTLNVSNLLNIGGSGSGTLGVVNGGDVILSAGSTAVIGTNVGATGTVTVTGLGSTWNGYSLIVGHFGSGELSIQNGGTIATSESAAGFSPGGSGTVTVKDAGSSWTMTGSLGIGGDAVNNIVGGNGSVSVESGGAVNVGGNTILFPSGSLKLQGGTFATAVLDNRGVLDVGGTLTATGGVVISGAGVLKGTGQIVGNVTNSGRVAPGNSPGIINIDGDYSQDAGGVLEIEVGGLTPGTQHDKVVVTGMATLAGRLEVPIINGFVPSANDPPITILDAASGVSGQFNSIFSRNLNSIAPGLALDVIQGANDVQLRFVPPSTAIQFQSTDVAAVWSVNNSWTTNTVPDETNDIVVQNLAGAPQTVSVATADAFLHKLTVSSDSNPVTLEVASGRSLASTAGVAIEGGGILAGNGTIVGNLAVGQVAGASSAVLSPGTATPGSEVGSLDISGDYSQRPTGVFEVTIKTAPAAGQFDTIEVSGQAQLDGTLRIDASQLGEVAIGVPYVFINAGEGVGKFDDIEVIGAPGVTDDFYFSPFYGSPSSTAGATLAALMDGEYQSGGRWLNKGDADADMDVDGDDARVFAAVLIKSDAHNIVLPDGHTAGQQYKDVFDFYTDGAMKGERIIDFDDIKCFVEALSKSQGTSLLTAYSVFDAAYQKALSAQVPEPSFVAMLFVSTCCFAFGRRCHAINY